ncbi:MAG: DUF87 domain-containing protein, partial [Candidatus Thorarchaeota archaeon]|nr:DUF87 domain-containing protein [Candidatus Thorarchaeota archaeon]
MVDRITGTLINVYQTFATSDIVGRFYYSYRTVYDIVTTNVAAGRLTSLFRSISDYFGIDSTITRGFVYARTVVGSLTISDTAGRLTSLFRFIADQITMNTLAGRIQSITQYISQSISMNTLSSRFLTAYRTVADSLSLTSLVDRITGTLITITDYLSISDAVNRLFTAYRILPEQIGINAMTGRLTSLLRTIIQPIDINIMTDRLASLFRTVSDYFGMSDEVSRLASIFRTLTESLNMNVMTSRFTSLFRTVSDYFGLDSAIIRGFVYARSVADSFTVSDATGRLTTLLRTIIEPLNINSLTVRLQSLTQIITQVIEVNPMTSRLLNAYRAVSDYFGMSNVADRMTGVLIRVYQSITVSPSAIRLTALLRMMVQSVDVNVMTSRLQSLFRTFSESFGISSGVMRGFVYMRNIYDSFTTSAITSRIVGFSRSVAENVYFNDITSRVQSLVRFVSEQFSFETRISLFGSISERVVGLAISISDSVSRAQTIMISISETFTIQTISSRFTTFLRMVFEWFTLFITGGPDQTPPEISVSANSAEPFGNVTIEANITDSGVVSKAFAQVTYPPLNGSVINYTLSHITGDTWRAVLLNLTDIGDYDFTVYANDSSNNWNNESSWFEVYVPAWFNGTARDAEDYPVQIVFSLYNTNNTRLLESFSTNATGHYSNIVHKRYYNFNLNTLNNIINLTGVSITSNINNATLIDSIPANSIGAANSRVAKAMYFQTILAYTGTTLVMDYTGTSYTSQTALGVYRCSDWVYSNRTPALSNSCWTRLSSTNDLIHKTVTVSSTELSGAYAVAEFICGDGVCDTAYGETNIFCPADCEIAPTPPGGSSGGGIPYTPRDEEETTAAPITLTTSTIELRLYPGEYQIVSVGITNNNRNNVTAELSVEGAIWPFTMFERDKVDMRGGETKFVDVKFTTMPTTVPGVYNGNILVKQGNTTQKISVILRVEYEREKLLDLKVEAITKSVVPGGVLEYQVTIYNLGMTKRVDIINNYTIKSTETQEILATDGESIAVEASTTFVRRMRIPENTALGLYVLEAVASYDDKTASSVTSFSVVEQPWIVKFLISLFTNWMTYIVLFVAIPSFYLGWKMYGKWNSDKRVRGRYVRPVKMGKLPKKGLWLGNVSETNSKAYFDDEKLTTHTIIAGGTGSGKTVAAMVMAEEALKKNIPVVVFDPTAQWTGFIRSNRDKGMLDNYKKFGMKEEEARSFKGSIVPIKDPFLKVEVEKYIKPGEMTVFTLNKLTPDQLDYFIRKTVDYMFSVSWPESRALKLMLVFDEVHRLLPKYSKKA